MAKKTRTTAETDEATVEVETTEVEDTDSDDEIEALDEVEETAEASEEAAPKKKAKKAKRPERTGMDTKTLAERLGTTPVKLRRFLRSEDGGHNDKTYTRYDFTDEEVARITEAWGKAQTAAKAPRAKKSDSSGEDAAEEVGEELADLEDSDDDEDVDLELEEGDSDEDEDDEE